MADGYTPSVDEARERPTIALAREIASWDQDNPGTGRIPHWAVNLAAHLIDKGYAHAEAVRAEEREKAAQIAEDAPGTEASGYYAGDHQAGYQEAQNYIAARIREQS